MHNDLDYGVRCERHVGEVFPPRCADCACEAVAADEKTAPVRLSRYIPNSECPVHRGWPMPCDRCGQIDLAVKR
jgi:hypothetical protein